MPDHLTQTFIPLNPPTHTHPCDLITTTRLNRPDRAKGRTEADKQMSVEKCGGRALCGPVLWSGQVQFFFSFFPLLLQQLLIQNLPDHHFTEIWHVTLHRQRQTGKGFLTVYHYCTFGCIKNIRKYTVTDIHLLLTFVHRSGITL